MNSCFEEEGFGGLVVVVVCFVEVAGACAGFELAIGCNDGSL